MFVTEKTSPFPSFRSSIKRYPLHDFDLIFKSFDDKLTSRLKSLAFSSPSHSISLHWLSRAVDLLSDTHADANAVISAMTSAGLSGDSLSFYLDHSVKLLDVCNSISYEIEKLRHRRLLMKFVTHLLKFSGDGDTHPAPENLKKASECIADYERNSRGFAKRRGFKVRDPDVLIRDLVNAIVTISPPRGKISTVERAVLRIIYAVGLFTVFVAGAALSSLCGLPELAKIRVPSEFCWTDSINELQTAIFDSDGRVVLTEVDDVAARAVSLRVLIDGGLTGVGEIARSEIAVKEIEILMDKMGEGLDRLDNGVNKLFGVVLSARNGVLDNYRVGPIEKRRK
ncbi:protein BPS1, chloroplastic-like [Apium graveolens]|uniref:protein BPS1, chloroplastic-like n=1 Tax=Apium graveolens TaxID=4045 RepID=UPI003D79B776